MERFEGELRRRFADELAFALDPADLLAVDGRALDIAARLGKKSLRRAPE